MNLPEYVKLLRARWVTVCVTMGVVVLCAIAITLLTTPLYQSSTRLFVATAPGASLAETYQGNRFSQERVISYSELLTGHTLAQRTIDKLDLDMTAEELQNQIEANAKLDSVLIKLYVTDPSPVQARDIANTLTDEFVAMVREVETPNADGVSDARIFVEQRAMAADTPLVPNAFRNIVVGLVLGLLAGIGLAIVRDMLDNTVKDGPAVEDIAGVGVAGRIPLNKDLRRRAAIAFEGKNSVTTEAFRKLRTNLQFLNVDNPPRVIMLTSSVSGEGKSTTAINLALALAEIEHNVVLVDGDLRCPKVHTYLGLIGQVGFSTVLSGGSTLRESVQPTRYPGLTVLASGPIPPNPSALLGSQSAKKVLAQLRADYDYVIVDSAPLLAVADASVLAASVDGVLLVTRYGKTRREQLEHSVASLQNVGAQLLGVAFTMSPAHAGSDSHSYTQYGGSQTSGRHALSKAPK